MQVNVRYFASVRDRMGKAEEAVNIDQANITVNDLWHHISGGEQLPSTTLIAVNMEYTDSAQLLKNGDEVAFFPPVTGG